MIKEDIKVGLKFSLTLSGCKKCGFEPLSITGGYPIVFEAINKENDGRFLCVHNVPNERIVAHISMSDIGEYGNKVESTEQVLHPSHYSWLKDLCGVEPIEICRHFSFSVGNALKYLMRKGKVDGDKTEKGKRIEDLKKAIFYLQDEIKMLENTK